MPMHFSPNFDCPPDQMTCWVVSLWKWGLLGIHCTSRWPQHRDTGSFAMVRNRDLNHKSRNLYHHLHLKPTWRARLSKSLSVLFSKLKVRSQMHRHFWNLYSAKCLKRIKAWYTHSFVSSTQFLILDHQTNLQGDLI